MACGREHRPESQLGISQRIAERPSRFPPRNVRTIEKCQLVLLVPFTGAEEQASGEAAPMVSTGHPQETVKVVPTVNVGHSDFVKEVVFSPDGRWLASLASDETVKLWEVATGRQAYWCDRPRASRIFLICGSHAQSLGCGRAAAFGMSPQAA